MHPTLVSALKLALQRRQDATRISSVTGDDISMYPGQTVRPSVHLLSWLLTLVAQCLAPSFGFVRYYPTFAETSASLLVSYTF